MPNAYKALRDAAWSQPWLGDDRAYEPALLDLPPWRVGLSVNR